MAGAMGISLCTKTGVSTPVRTATAELRHLSLHNEVQAHLVQDPLLNQRVQIRKKFWKSSPRKSNSLDHGEGSAPRQGSRKPGTSTTCTTGVSTTLSTSK